MVENLVKKGNEGLCYKDPHTCIVCQKISKHSGQLYSHIERTHIRTNKMHCDICPKIFFALADIKKHMIVHRKKALKCNVCDFKTNRNYKLQLHKLIHAKVECKICKRQVSNLKRHLNTHSTTHKPKATCPICDKVYSKANIKKHLKIHDKPFGCKKCSENYETKFDLKR